MLLKQKETNKQKFLIFYIGKLHREIKLFSWQRMC